MLPGIGWKMDLFRQESDEDTLKLIVYNIDIRTVLLLYCSGNVDRKENSYYNYQWSCPAIYRTLYAKGIT